MISLAAALGIGAVSLGMVLTPGPNMIYLVSRSITQGRRAGLISLSGMAVGFGIYLFAAVAGLSTVFAYVPAAYTALKIAGACYLLYLAWQALRPGGKSPFTPKDLPKDSPRRLFAMGLVTNLLNPKIAILYVSLLPQFVDPARGSVAAQSLVLGLIQIAIALTFNSLYTLTAGSLSAFMTGRPLWMKIQRWVMGTVLAGLAVRMLTDRGKAVVTP